MYVYLYVVICIVVPFIQTKKVKSHETSTLPVHYCTLMLEYTIYNSDMTGIYVVSRHIFSSFLLQQPRQQHISSPGAVGRHTNGYGLIIVSYNPCAKRILDMPTIKTLLISYIYNSSPFHQQINMHGHHLQ